MNRLLALLLLVLACSPPHARGQAMVAATQEAQDRLDQADAELNVVYKKALQDLSPRGTAALKEAQRAWIVFRDKSGEAYGTHEKGSLQSGWLAIECRTTLTRERTADLRKMFLSNAEDF